ncbi:MAG: cobalamin biosynthesis protein, partial [Pseudomonadota bacterium]
QIFSGDRLLVAIAALLLVMFGGMIRGALGGNANPFLWHLVDLIFGKFGAKMNKKGRPKGDLIFRGFMLGIFVIALVFLLGRALEVLGDHYSTWSLIDILALSAVLSSGAVFASMGRLYRALNEKKVTPGAYFSIARSTRTDLSKNDDYTITRVGMGFALKSFDKAVVAPILWYLIAGLAGAYLYAALAALRWRFGKEGHSGGFGDAMIALEKLMGYIPNIFSGLLICLAGLLTPTAGMTRAFLGLGKQKGQAKYEEGGLPVTAAAYSLNVSLGGPTTDLDGDTIKRSWIGPDKATAQLESVHLHRVVYICFMAHLLWLAGLSFAAVFEGNGLNLGFLPF